MREDQKVAILLTILGKENEDWWLYEETDPNWWWLRLWLVRN